MTDINKEYHVEVMGECPHEFKIAESAGHKHYIAPIYHTIHVFKCACGQESRGTREFGLFNKNTIPSYDTDDSVFRRGVVELLKADQELGIDMNGDYTVVSTKFINGKLVVYSRDPNEIHAVMKGVIKLRKGGLPME